MNVRRMALSAVCCSLTVGMLSAVAAAEEAAADQQKKSKALDIVVADAQLAVAIRDIEDLTKRGDEFLAATEFKSTFRLSDGYRLVVDFLGLRGGKDEQGAAALMMLGDPKGSFESLVLAVPVSDFAAMAGNFGLERKHLVEGAIIDRAQREPKDNQSVRLARYLAVRGDHLLMGSRRESVALAAKGKSLRDVLPVEDRDTLADDDILIFANTVANRDAWYDTVEQLQQPSPDATEEEADTLRRLAAAAKDLRYIVGGVRLEKGLGASLLLQFEGDKSRRILASLERSSAPTTLDGLPAGDVVAAHASSGRGQQSAVVASVLLGHALEALSVDTDPLVSVAHQPNVVGVFGEVWQRLLGSRSALYRNERPDRDGMFSLLAVLETDDAEQFLDDMQDLARFVNMSSLTGDDFGEPVADKTIAQLIDQLGAPEYALRQSATTKLGLIGAPALAALEEAEKSDDAEVRYRAGMLRAQINASIEQQRDDLVQRDLLSRLRPSFGYFPRQETRAGRAVDIVQMRLSGEEGPYAVQLRQLLGPQWSKLRMATVGKRVVVLAGSNTALLDEALAGLEDKGKGLADDARFARFRARSDRRPTAEFHLSLARAETAVSPTSPPREPVGAASLTSFGLTIAPQRVRVDFFAPLEEVRAVVKRLPW